MKEKTLEFLDSCNHCVISTLSTDNKPQSAFVGFSEDNNLELVIGTQKKTRKYSNIIANPIVSIVIADQERKLEIQYEGIAKIFKSEELAQRLKQHFKKIPAAEKRLNDPNQVWIKVSPTWIRYVDANFSPIKFEEMRVT